MESRHVWTLGLLSFIEHSKEGRAGSSCVKPMRVILSAVNMTAKAEIKRFIDVEDHRFLQLTLELPTLYSSNGTNHVICINTYANFVRRVYDDVLATLDSSEGFADRVLIFCGDRKRLRIMSDMFYSGGQSTKSSSTISESEANDEGLVEISLPSKHCWSHTHTSFNDGRHRSSISMLGPPPQTIILTTDTFCAGPNVAADVVVSMQLPQFEKAMTLEAATHVVESRTRRARGLNSDRGIHVVYYHEEKDQGYAPMLLSLLEKNGRSIPPKLSKETVYAGDDVEKAGACYEDGFKASYTEDIVETFCSSN